MFQFNKESFDPNNGLSILTPNFLLSRLQTNLKTATTRHIYFVFIFMHFNFATLLFGDLTFAT